MVHIQSRRIKRVLFRKKEKEREYNHVNALKVVLYCTYLLPIEILKFSNYLFSFICQYIVSSM